jgi:hypothetical protein
MRTLTTMMLIGAQKGTSIIDNGFKACKKKKHQKFHTAAIPPDIF